MTKTELIVTLKLCIKSLEKIPMNDDTRMFSSIDQGGYGSGMEEIEDFDMGIDFDEDENYLMISSRYERKDF